MSFLKDNILCRVIFVHILFLIFTQYLTSQQRFLVADEYEHLYGIVENVYQLQSDFVLKNTGEKNIYLLRADAEGGLKIWTSKRTIVPGDTALVFVRFCPKEKGRFNHKVQLITSESSDPFVLRIKGVVASIKPDDKTACFYFQNRKPKKKKRDEDMVVSIPIRTSNLKTENEERDEPSEIITDSAEVDLQKKTDSIETNWSVATLLPPAEYMANNVIFLVDVSGSMADSTKLRWLKLSMKKLIENIRPSDRISLVCYRDSVICLAEGMSYKDKSRLSFLTDSIKAKGMTRGNKAIHYALDMAIRNYLPDGNNQIILASDGVFSFKDYDYRAWTEKVGDKKIYLSALAFGRDSKALGNLREISEKGSGSFIHIKSRKVAQSAIFDEIEQRSRKFKK